MNITECTGCYQWRSIRLALQIKRFKRVLVMIGLTIHVKA